jgi:hypothetical protein
METTTTTTTPPMSGDEVEGLPPVVFKSINSIPDFEGRTPDQEYLCQHFTLNYYKPDLMGPGHYDLVSLNNSDNAIKLYQSGMRTLVKNLDQAFRAVRKLESMKDNLDPNETFEVCILSSTKTVSTRLVLANFQNTISAFLKLYRKDDNGLIFLTSKSIRFSELDDTLALAEFIKGKK